MKNLLATFLFILTVTLANAQVNFQSHRVQKGETLYSISKDYNVSENDITTLNPEVKNGLKENAVLIIPVKVEVNTESTSDVPLKTHKVKRKETLYSISKKYGVSIDNIKKYNKDLYANETLKRGQTLKIPRGAVVITSTPIPSRSQQNNEPVSNSGKHTVSEKETKFGIAKMYNISIAELERLNPVISDTNNLPVGLILNVPVAEEEKDKEETDENILLYEVKPQEGFYRLKVKFDVTQEEIIALNPEAKEGLKQGMILKIPTKNTTQISAEEEVKVHNVAVLDLEKTITVKRIRNIVLALPFELNAIDIDSIHLVEDKIIKDPILRLSLDFYSGALMALETAKEKGFSVNLHVFDSQALNDNSAAFLRQKNLKNVDVIIGPLRQSSVEKVASEMQPYNIPVLSPLSNRQTKSYQNFIHSITSNTMLEEEMVSYLKANAEGKNMLLVSDATKSAQQQKLIRAFPGIQVIRPREGGYYRAEDFTNFIHEDQENWVLLESTNATMVNSAIGILNSLNKDQNIRLFTTDRNNAFDYYNISNLHLANLSFTFPSVSKSYVQEDSAHFFNAYRKAYGTFPNRFAIRGYDVMYDVVLRLGQENSFMESLAQIDGATEYTENKFYYIKNPKGGYINAATYLLKYTKDLALEVIQ